MAQFSRRSFLAAATAIALLRPSQAAETIPGFDQTQTDYDRTRELIVCYSQGEYLEAGRIRGEYAGFNQTFVGDATGKKRYEETLKRGLQLKK
jgi:hypothetical protein